MLKRGCSFVAAMVLFATATTAGEAVARPPIPGDAASEQRAGDLRKKGNALSREGRLADAVEAYSSSFKISETFAVAANLGSLELKLERYRDAADHLALAIRMSPPDAKPVVTEALKSALADAKAHVGALKIRVTLDNPDVAVDGRPLDGSDLASEVYVEPGTHTITATRAGYAESRKTVDVQAGALLEVELTPAPSSSVPAPPAEPASPAATPSAASGGTSMRVPLLITGAGTATVGSVLGIVFTIGANGKSAQAHALGDDLRARSGYAACAQPSAANAAACRTLKSTITSQSTFANTAAWSFIAGGAVAVATGVYAVWPVLRSKLTSASHLQALPTVSAHFGGVVVIGAF